MTQTQRKFALESPEGQIFIDVVPAPSNSALHVVWRLTDDGWSADRILYDTVNQPSYLTSVDPPRARGANTRPGWIWDPDYRPDRIAEQVFDFVRQLPVEHFVRILRETTKDHRIVQDVAVTDLLADLEATRVDLQEAKLMEAAALFDSADQRRLALELRSTWSGSVEDFTAAVRDVFPDPEEG